MAEDRLKIIVFLAAKDRSRIEAVIKSCRPEGGPAVTDDMIGGFMTRAAMKLVDDFETQQLREAKGENVKAGNIALIEKTLAKLQTEVADLKRILRLMITDDV